jgi:putative tryptophan/tyrosine transport system substrate-binding protein
MLDLRRRQFITLLGGAAAAWPLVARAQAPRNIPRLCFLTFDPSTPQLNRFDPFFQGLRDLGYANGQDIVIDYLSAEGNGERFPALVAECLRLKADVIAVSTTPASSNASRAAERCGDLPFFGQPFGMTHRRLSREVMSMNWGREPGRNR